MGPISIQVFPLRVGLDFLGVIWLGCITQAPQFLSFSPLFSTIYPVLLTGVGSRATWLDLGVYLPLYR